MPFAVKNALQYKLNDRQVRDMHEKGYSDYVTNLRQQQHSQHSNQYHLSVNHIQEVERSRRRYALEKRNQYDRIYRENHEFYDRILRASKQPLIDNKNHMYQQHLNTSNSKRMQQRSKEYTRINNDNQSLLKRINSVQGNLVSRQECENDWKKHINIMKKSCDYPENIDKFVTKMKKNEAKQACLYSSMRNAQWNKRHCIIEPSTRLTVTPLARLLDES